MDETGCCECEFKWGGVTHYFSIMVWNYFSNRTIFQFHINSLELYCQFSEDFYLSRTTMIRRMLWDLETQYAKAMKSKEECASNEEMLSLMQKGSEVTKFPQEQSTSLIPGARTKVYRPLLSRPTCGKLDWVLLMYS